jgi:uncharacterized Fe-S radical SAM superfamily protein PflX
MYGQNYIYEPIYYNTLIYNFFWSYNTDRMYQTGIGIIIHHTIMPGILFLCTDTETIFKLA